MARTVAVVLVLVNLALFVWYQFFMPDNSIPDSKSIAYLTEVEDVNPFRLLGELSMDERKYLQRSDSATRQVQKPSAEKPDCWMIGPFQGESAGRKFRENVQSRGAAVQLRKVQFEGESVFMVYLGPFGSEAQARERLRQLHQKGKESFLITSGSLKNGISVGVFSSEKRADIVYAEYHSAGYPVGRTTKPKLVTEIWASVAPDEYRKMSESQWFSAISRFKNVDKRQNFCEAVASYPNID